MDPTIVMPPLVITGRQFPNVFVFPPDRIFDPGNNVLLVANLFNFEINGDRTKPDHDLWLGSVATPLLADNPDAGARLIGLASRSGPDAYNMRLSLRRAKNVETSLSLFLILHDLTNPPSPPPRVSVGAQGEHFAASLGVADGTEDARWRSVLVTILADRTLNTPVRLLTT
jgi:hypothetical protein